MVEDPCCDLHGRNCEQGGEECCNDCTEALHFAPGHGGVACSAPDLGGFATGGLYTGPPPLDESGCSLPWPMVINSALPADTVLVGDFTEIARAAAERRPVNWKAFALLKLDAPLSDAAVDLAETPEVDRGQ